MKSIDLHTKSEEELLDVFRRVVYHGENNSALLIGPRGSGKTFLIKQVLLSLKHELREKNCSDDLIIVSLSGCLQGDDKSALLEISRQLKLDNVVNDKVFGSFSDSFEFLLKSFRTGDKQSKPLIFVMDEFDLFTKNKTQLLLYTILNTIQTTSSPMCLIGLTCRIDVLDLLEKRIKSRFSHRQIYLFNDYDFDKYIEMAKFFIENNHLNESVPVESSFKMKINKHLKEFLADLFNDNDLLKLFNRLFEYDKSIPSLKSLLMLPSLKLKELDQDMIVKKNYQLVKEDMIKSFKVFNIDAKFSLLTGLSILELTLIVVMLEMSETYVDEPFNFDLIFNSYLKFLQRKNWFQQKQERQVLLKAYEHLIALRFILPASESTSNSSRSTKINKEHSLMYLALDKDEIERCIAQYPNCPTELSLHSKVF